MEDSDKFTARMLTKLQVTSAAAIVIISSIVVINVYKHFFYKTCF